MNRRVAARAVEPPTLAEEPRDFFMTLRDVAFWVRSARADAELARLRASAAPGEAFDKLYNASEDPYASTLPQYRYQRRKYCALLSILPNRRYRDVLDIGCGLGAFPRALAPHADRVLGIDVSPRAVSQASALSAGFTNVRFETGDVGTFQSSVRFSLIVMADVIYYLSPLNAATIEEVRGRLAELLEPGGLLLLVNHYFFAIDPASRSTRHIHDAFTADRRLTVQTERRRAFYLATLFERR